jgi:hypothetical protein
MQLSMKMSTILGGVIDGITFASRNPAEKTGVPQEQGRCSSSDGRAPDGSRSHVHLFAAVRVDLLVLQVQARRSSL